MTKSINTNCLEDIRCPKCGAEDQFRVRIEISVLVNDDGTDDEPGTREWNDDTVTQCTGCGHHGPMRDFRTDASSPESDAATQEKPALKNYDVLFAQDVPHYGTVLVEAENDEQALAEAKAHWQKVARDEAPWPLTDPQHDNAVLARIISIRDPGREVATDIPLDDFLLQSAPTELDRRIFDNAKPIFDSLQAIMHWWQNTAHTDDDEMPADLFDQAQSAIAKITGLGWRLVDFDGAGLLHIEKDDSTDTFRTDADAVAYVRLLAARGDFEAQRAIRFHDLNQPKIDRLRDAP